MGIAWRQQRTGSKVDDRANGGKEAKGRGRISVEAEVRKKAKEQEGANKRSMKENAAGYKTGWDRMEAG